MAQLRLLHPSIDVLHVLAWLSLELASLLSIFQPCPYDYALIPQDDIPVFDSLRIIHKCIVSKSSIICMVMQHLHAG